MKRDEALEMVSISDTGRVRSHNEDSIASDRSLGLAVLADGMGGYRAGEVASAIAVTQVFREVRAGLMSLVPGQTDGESGLRYESLIVRDAIRHANGEVYDMARRDQEFDGMGTTIVASHFYDNFMTCAHVGDSRMYLLRDASMTQLTVDHTVVQEFVQNGLYSEAEAKASFDSNLVTRALGVDEEIEIDIHEQPVLPGDVYMICSDGLTSTVAETKILKTLQKKQRLEDCARRLTQQANRGGGDDNISVVLIRINAEFEAEQNWQTQMLDWFNPG